MNKVTGLAGQPFANPKTWQQKTHSRGEISPNPDSRLKPLNDPAQAIVKTQGAFPPLRVGGADGERAGVRCASHHLGVHGKDAGEGERLNILSITDAVASLTSQHTIAPPHKTISSVSCISWLNPFSAPSVLCVLCVLLWPGLCSSRGYSFSCLCFCAFCDFSRPWITGKCQDSQGWISPNVQPRTNTDGPGFQISFVYFVVRIKTRFFNALSPFRIKWQAK